MYFILGGWVKVRTINPDGKEVTLNILGKGELFGEMAALDEAPRCADVITLTPTEMGNMPAYDFVQLIHTEPLAGVKLSKLMAQRLRQVNRRLRCRESDSMSRVADTLMFLAEGQGIQCQTGTSIPYDCTAAKHTLAVDCSEFPRQLGKAGDDRNQLGCPDWFSHM